MKTFVRIVTVLVVLNLVMGSFALAPGASEKEEMEVAKREMDAAKEDMKKAGEKMREAGQKMREAGERYRHDPFTGLPRGRSTLQRSGAGRVLVIPAAETNVEYLVTIMEDMSVMSRIIDKKLDQSHTVSGRFYGSLDFGSGFPFSWGSRGTEGIYLDGYGALFLIKVDFPLAPVPEAVEEEIEEEPADLVWEQTRQEIFEPMDVRGKRDYFRHEEEREYDAEKVEELKDKLIKALKHAANIRNLKPEEWVILTVVGETEQTGEVIVSRIYTVIKGDDITADVPLPLPIETDFPSPGVLTIRVKKSDAEAFSKGELDFDKFCKRVQIFTY